MRQMRVDKRRTEKVDGQIQTRIPISLEQRRELAASLHTIAEIAAKLGVSHDTLQRRLKEAPFQEAFQAGHELGCAEVRTLQLEQARAGNTQMLIHLGKHYLGQRDQLDQTLSTPDGAGLRIEIVRVSTRSEIETEASAERP
jgi:hypothetical protein